MQNGLPNWAKFLIGFAAPLVLGFLALNLYLSQATIYLMIALALLIGGFLFWKKENAYAAGVFVAVLLSAAVWLWFVKNMR